MNKTDSVLSYIVHNDGTTQTEIIRAFGHKFFGSTPQYGSQRQASTTIADLREKGFIKDVGKRCATCGSALTRGKKNVRLHATQEGLDHLDSLVGMLKAG